MTTGTDALKIAFRDFLILNVPSSGPNKPFKAEVRAALNILAEDIAAAASGQNIKVNVRSASTANIALSSGLVNGTVIDGVTLVTGDRVLVWNQSAPWQNGIYIVPASGAASRATDADTADEVTGMVVIVNEGTAWGGWQFNLLTPAPIVLGTTDLNFTPTVNYGEIATSYIQPLLDDAESAAASAAASAAYVIGIDEDIRPKVDQDIVVGGVSDTGENIPRTATAVVSRVRTGGQPLSSGWRGIAAGLLVGTDIDIGAIANSINLDLIASADLTQLRKKVWHRPSDVANINAVPGSTGDVLLSEGDSSVAELGLIADDTSLIGVRLPIGPVSTGGMASGDVLIIEITGLDDSEDGQPIGFGQYAYGGSPPAHQRGWIMNSSDVWAAYPGAAGPAYTLVFESVNVNSTLARIDGELEAIGDALTSANEVLHDRPAVGSYPISTGYGGVGFALVSPDVTPGDQLYGFATPFQTGPSADSLIVRLMHRPSTVTATLSYFNAGDIELDASVIPLTETNIVAGGPLSYYEHFFPAVWTYPADGFLYVTIEPIDESGEGVACGFGQALQSGWAGERKGMYRSTLASKAWSALGSFSVPFRLLKKGYSAAGSGADNALRADDVVTDVVATLDGNDVVLSVSLERGGNVTKINGTVEFTLPSPSTVTGESITLNPSGGSIAYALIPSGGRLDHAAVSEVVVAGYTEGDDYIVNYEQGGIASVVVEDAAATVNYKWSDIYTDLIVLNRLSGAFEVIVGEGRGADSSEARAVPTGPEQIPICYVRRSHLGLHLGRLYFGAEAYKERLFTNRQRTSKLLSRLSAGLPVNWASYGDSITMIGAPDDSTWYVPNTEFRDIGRAYFSGYLANDIRNAIPVYTSLELFGVDDGAGAVHTKIGLNWQAIDACAERYGSQINYFNMGLGGTTSASTGGVSPIRPNGTNPDRLEALVEVADRLDVVVINFGMNQPSSTTTADEYVTMAEYIRAAHPDCDLIFVGQAKPNDIYRAGDAWEVQNRAIAWAADYVGAAYIDTTLLWGRNDEGGLLGLPAVDVASCGWTNHPGLLEFTGMARLLSDTLLLDGAALVFNPPTADPGVTRPFVQRMRDSVSALDLMSSGGLDEAVRNRETTSADSSEIFAAMQDVLEACATKQWRMDVPAGRYWLNAQLIAEKPVHIIGHGSDAVQLYWDAASLTEGVKIEAGGVVATSMVSDMTLYTAKVATTDAVTLDYSSLISGGTIVPRAETHGKVLRIKTLGAGGYTVNGWNRGLVGVSLLGLDVDSCRFNGVNTGTYGSMPNSAAGIDFGGEGAPIQLTVRATMVSVFDTGIYTHDAEGIYITAGTELVTVGTGVRVQNAVPESGMVLDGIHVACIEHGFDIGEMEDIAITNNLLYTINPATGSGSFIRLRDGAEKIDIRGNIARRMAGPSMDGVVIENGVSEVTVGHNTWYLNGQTSTERVIRIDAGATDIIVDRQSYLHSTSGALQQIENASSTAYFDEFPNYAGNVDDINTSFRKVKQVHRLVTGATGLPAGLSASGSTVETVSGTPSTCVQTLVNIGRSDRIYQRSRNGTYGPWKIVTELSVQEISTNADVTLTTLVDNIMIRHTGTLSADRVVTLSTTNAYDGAKFRVTRAGGSSGGTFALSVGGLKNLATNTWCEVVYVASVSGWRLFQYGAL